MHLFALSFCRTSIKIKDYTQITIFSGLNSNFFVVVSKRIEMEDDCFASSHIALPII